jgi:hypothetical protein
MANEIIRRDTPWREKPLAMKVLAVLLAISWIAGATSMLVVGGVETVAQRQPNRPTAIYRHAHEIRGSIRYFTDTQQILHSIAMPTLIVGFALFGVVRRWLRNVATSRL